MTKITDDAQEFARKMATLSLEDQASVLSLAETGQVPAEDKADFARYQSAVKRCPVCGKALRPLGAHSRRRFCCNGCKQRAYRGRREADRVQRAG